MMTPLFTFYLVFMGLGVVFSLPRSKSLTLALTYMAIIAGFHCAFWNIQYSWGLWWYVLCGGTQFGIAVLAAEVIITPASKPVAALAGLAVATNLVTFVLLAYYPHAIYYWIINGVQVGQCASFLFLSPTAFWMIKRVGLRFKKGQDLHLHHRVTA